MDKGQNNQSVQHDMAKIFVGGLSWQTTEETLRYHFEQYGEVVSVEVMRDRNTGDPRGFAFVVFKEDATVELIMANMPHEINHKIVDVKRAQARGTAPPSIHHGGAGGAGGGGPPSHHHHYGGSGNNTSSTVIATTTGGGGGDHTKQYGEGNDSHEITQQQNPHHSTKEQHLSPEQLQNKVFVGGLPLHMTREGLHDFFSQFGPVVDAIVMMDANQNRSRGFGFVTFENGSGGAQLALKAQPIHIDNKYVEIKLATPKGGGGGAGGDGQHNPTIGGGSAGGSGSGVGGMKRYQNQNNQLPTTLPHVLGSTVANSSNSQQQPSGEFAGLAASYGRNGWKAGYGSRAFGSAGWAVNGWTGGVLPEKSGFSFSLLEQAKQKKNIADGVATRPKKKSKHND